MKALGASGWGTKALGASGWGTKALGTSGWGATVRGCGMGGGGELGAHGPSVGNEHRSRHAWGKEQRT